MSETPGAPTAPPHARLEAGLRQLVPTDPVVRARQMESLLRELIAEGASR